MKNFLKPISTTVSRQRGVTLIEAVLFIVISLGLIVGGIIFFQQANLASRVNDTLRVVTGIQSETRALFASQASFGADVPLNGLLVQSGAVPTSILGAGATDLVNAWGGAIEVEGDGNVFTVTLADIPVAACARIASVDANGTGPAGVGITAVSITNGAGTQVVHTVATAPDVLTPSAAAEDCATGGDALSTVAWTFTR